jgi:hypothetical protein
MNQECPDFVKRLLEFFHKKNGNSAVLWDLKKRFLFLLGFCKSYGLEQGQFELAYQWLLSGFPIAAGPDEYSQKASGIPEGAELISGTEECISKPETRFWSLGTEKKTIYLAYNR